MYFLDRIPGKGKFEDQAKKGIFFGYAANSKRYRVWLPEERKVEISRDVKFLQNREDPPIVDEDFTPEDVSTLQEKGSSIPDTMNKVTEIKMKLIGNNLDVPSEEEIHEASDHEADAEETPRRGPGRPRILQTGMRDRPRKLFSVPCEAFNVVKM